VEEAPITLEEALRADEVFTSGTAVVVSPVGSLTHKGQKTQFGKPGVPGMFRKKRKHYTFQRQFNEKPSIIPGCPAQVCSHQWPGRHVQLLHLVGHQCVSAISCGIDQKVCWKELSVMVFHVC